jgi:hypothetical protein
MSPFPDALVPPPLMLLAAPAEVCSVTSVPLLSAALMVPAAGRRS